MDLLLSLVDRMLAFGGNRRARLWWREEGWRCRGVR
jgi:hypothetical protein